MDEFYSIFLGAFLGFCSAFFAQATIKHIIDYCDFENAHQGLIEEIIHNKTLAQETDVPYILFNTSVWDSLIFTGIYVKLMNDPSYKHVLLVYTYIETHNLAQSMCHESHNTKYDSLLNEMKDKRKNIVISAEKAEKELEKKRWKLKCVVRKAHG